MKKQLADRARPSDLGFLRAPKTAAVLTEVGDFVASRNFRALPPESFGAVKSFLLDSFVPGVAGALDANTMQSAPGRWGAGVRPMVRARRTASSSNSCVNPFSLVIEFAFHLRKTLHFIGPRPLCATVRSVRFPDRGTALRGSK